MLLTDLTSRKFVSSAKNISSIRLVPLLQQIIEAAKHCELLRRIETELDSLAKYHYQPNIHVHWPVVQNQVHTSLKIHFSCSGYEMCTKQFGMHSILLNIGVDKCQVLNVH